MFRCGGKDGLAPRAELRNYFGTTRVLRGLLRAGSHSPSFVPSHPLSSDFTPQMSTTFLHLGKTLEDTMEKIEREEKVKRHFHFQGSRFYLNVTPLILLPPFFQPPPTPRHPHAAYSASISSRRRFFKNRAVPSRNVMRSPFSRCSSPRCEMNRRTSCSRHVPE